MRPARTFHFCSRTAENSGGNSQPSLFFGQRTAGDPGFRWNGDRWLLICCKEQQKQ
jgi:hypothetical protein